VLRVLALPVGLTLLDVVVQSLLHGARGLRPVAVLELLKLLLVLRVIDAVLLGLLVPAADLSDEPGLLRRVLREHGSQLLQLRLLSQPLLAQRFCEQRLAMACREGRGRAEGVPQGRGGGA
jgi:hypothetical protein